MRSLIRYSLLLSRRLVILQGDVVHVAVVDPSGRLALPEPGIPRHRRFLLMAVFLSTQEPGIRLSTLIVSAPNTRPNIQMIWVLFRGGRSRVRRLLILQVLASRGSGLRGRLASIVIWQLLLAIIVRLACIPLWRYGQLARVKGGCV